MFKGKCLNILLFCFIHSIYIFDVIKKKRKQTVIFLSFLSIYLFIAKVQFEVKVHDKLTFVEILRSLPSNQRRVYVWNIALERLENKSFSSEFENDYLNHNQTIQQLIESIIQRYKVIFT